MSGDLVMRDPVFQAAVERQDARVRAVNAGEEWVIHGPGETMDVLRRVLSDTPAEGCEDDVVAIMLGGAAYVVEALAEGSPLSAAVQGAVLGAFQLGMYVAEGRAR